jgi:hypothetical protein
MSGRQSIQEELMAKWFISGFDRDSFGDRARTRTRKADHRGRRVGDQNHPKNGITRAEQDRIGDCSEYARIGLMPLI